MYAVVVTGGKQYKVRVGEVLTVEKLDVPTGQDVQFDNVLLISDEAAGVTMGSPTIAGAVVTGKVVRHDRGPKIIVFKYKPKVRYRRKTGHRQDQTHVLVRAIDAPGIESRQKAEAQAPVVAEAEAVARAVAETPLPVETPIAVEVEAPTPVVVEVPAGV